MAVKEEVEEEKEMGKELVNTVLPILLVLAVIFLITNVAFLQIRAAKWRTAQDIINEKLRPAELQVITLTINTCSFCFDIEEAIIQLKTLNVNITEEKSIESTSAEGIALIGKYGIAKLPAYLLSGELNKSEPLINYLNNNGEIKERRFIFTAVQVPHYDVPLQKPVGLVSIFTIRDSSCPECTDLSKIPIALKERGVFIQTNREVDFKSDAGQELIDKHGIKEIPALLISKDIDYYENVQQELVQAGASEKNGFYAVHAIAPPYRDLATDKIVGLVEVIFLRDASCALCYDAMVTMQILKRFGLVTKRIVSHDVNSPEGKALREKYTITKIPITLLSPDAAAYPALVQVWKSVGTKESDGWFVMRRPELLGTYRDLETNRTITPQQGR